ncbi:hypothetical protein MFLAVUS_001114, partial [Mucor flavus]
SKLPVELVGEEKKLKRLQENVNNNTSSTEQPNKKLRSSNDNTPTIPVQENVPTPPPSVVTPVATPKK